VAEKVSVQLVDDLDGSVAESTVEFGLDGVSYAIDLSSGNAETLRDALGPYVANARRTGGRKRPGAPNGRPSARNGKVAEAPGAGDRERNQSIRQWAREQGKKVSERGRISADIVAAYDKAHRRTRSRSRARAR
jgi:hypothetical protein